jgi:RHS repeat-associated protein
MNNKSLKKSITKIMVANLIALITIQPALVAAAQVSEAFYFTHDRQGSLTGVYNAANDSILDQGWSPWGVRVDHEGQSTQARFNQGLSMRRGYTDHKQLLDSDLVFAGDTRLYDPKLKRFYNTDDRTTGGVRGMNRFSYAYNNPLKYVDLNGHAPSGSDSDSDSWSMDDDEELLQMEMGVNDVEQTTRLMRQTSSMLMGNSSSHEFSIQVDSFTTIPFYGPIPSIAHRSSTAFDNTAATKHLSHAMAFGITMAAVGLIAKQEDTLGVGIFIAFNAIRGYRSLYGIGSNYNNMDLRYLSAFATLAAINIPTRYIKAALTTAVSGNRALNMQRAHCIAACDLAVALSDAYYGVNSENKFLVQWAAGLFGAQDRSLGSIAAAIDGVAANALVIDPVKALIWVGVADAMGAGDYNAGYYVATASQAIITNSVFQFTTTGLGFINKDNPSAFARGLRINRRIVGTAAVIAIKYGFGSTVALLGGG